MIRTYTLKISQPLSQTLYVQRLSIILAMSLHMKYIVNDGYYLTDIMLIISSKMLSQCNISRRIKTSQTHTLLCNCAHLLCFFENNILRNYDIGAEAKVPSE